MPQPATQVVTFQLPSSSERASRSISSGCNGSQGGRSTPAKPTSTLPAPVLSAARAASSAAPVMPGPPPTTPTVPKLPLWLSFARREQGGQVIAADGAPAARTGVFMGWASRAGGSGTARAIHYSAPRRPAGVTGEDNDRHHAGTLRRLRVPEAAPASRGVLELIMGAKDGLPGKLSTADDRMHRELADIWRDIDTDPDTRVVVIRGEGKGFPAAATWAGGRWPTISTCAPSRRARPATWSTTSSTATSPSFPPCTARRWAPACGRAACRHLHRRAQRTHHRRP